MRAELTPASRNASSGLHACVLERRLDTSCDEAGRELEAVAAAQRLLLPNDVPTVPGLELAVSYRPARQAGGDYYDFLALPDGRWGLFVADVSGHGAAAAIVAAVVHATLHGSPDRSDPAVLLTYLNGRLRGSREEWSGSFVTAFYAVYDPSRRSIAYASAGHPPARLFSHADGAVRALDGSRGLPLGIVTDDTFVTATVSAGAGDVLVLYTDGITEARDADGEWFGLGRLDDSIIRGDGSAPATLTALAAKLELFGNGRRRADDQTVVVAAVR